MMYNPIRFKLSMIQDSYKCMNTQIFWYKFEKKKDKLPQVEFNHMTRFNILLVERNQHSLARVLTIWIWARLSSNI